ncbi:MAG: prepilin-type N-terminal cleavage/methylation domain-containing protein [Oscillospiraceae bacterium]|nr:prepilin-type N-terminal cleavage/methylation domain-containing protein [Oscillospiraceae bacterium]
MKKFHHLHSVRRNKQAGFTMVEVLVVIAIIGILAAIIMPIMTGMLNRSRQTSRENTARTLYVSVQNQLTKSMLEKNIMSTVTGFFYEPDPSNPGEFLKNADGTYQLNTHNVVKTELDNNGGTFPADEVLNGNEDNVRYISKPADYRPENDPDPNENETKALYRILLNGFIEREVLDCAILIEFNVRTGLVMSIFYGNADQTEFIYDDIADNDINNVTGLRGMDYLDTAIARRQGYYGAETTGVPLPPLSRDENIVNIYDGAVYPLFTSAGVKTNVLYAEFLLLEEAVMPSYEFKLVEADTGINIPGTTQIVDLSTVPTSFTLNASGPSIYQDILNPIELGGEDVSDIFNRYIWIIDIAEGDMSAGEAFVHSIGDKYGITWAQNVRVYSLRDGSDEGNTSHTEANTLFSRELATDEYEIISARHLNNIRFLPADTYRQRKDIDMKPAFHEITNFAPIENFCGSYSGMKGFADQYVIENLAISVTSGDGGLFSDNNGVIQGLTVSGADIKGTNCGVIAAANSGTISKVNVIDSKISGQSASGNAGGITGINQPGAEIKDVCVIELSILNMADSAGGIAGRNYGVISCAGVEESEIKCVGINIGGIAGYNEAGAEIKDVYFLSTNSVDLASIPIASNGGGIVGQNNGLITVAFYLAPAPFDPVSANYYPIVRSGDPGGIFDGAKYTGCFFLAGYKYSTTSGISWPTTNLYYNCSPDEFHIFNGNTENNCTSMTTDFMDKEWINYVYGREPIPIGDVCPDCGKDPLDENDPCDCIYVNLSNWIHEGSYPYPVLRTLKTPVKWAEAASSRDQKENENFGKELSEGNKVKSVDFKNGAFNLPFQYPTAPIYRDFYTNTDNGSGNWLVQKPTPYPSVDPGVTGAAWMGGRTFWVYFNQDYIQGWQTRPVDGTYTCVRPSGVTRCAYYPTGTMPSNHTHNSFENKFGDNTRSNAHNSTDHGIGQFTWEAIEYQRPSNTAADSRARINYNGKYNTGDTAYVELNAELESTMYQVCTTSPGQSFYYSFHHLTRTNGTNNPGEKMSFYLSLIPTDQNELVKNQEQLAARDAELVLIRPCWSPRSQPGSNPSVTNAASYAQNSRFYNPIAANTVAYGNTYVGSLYKYWNDKPEFNQLEGQPLSAQCNWGTNPYIYDVWIGTAGAGDTGTRSGFGVTFWSNTNITALNSTSHTGFATLDALYLTAPQAKTNTFAYWTINYGWKNYYGQYTAPTNPGAEYITVEGTSVTTRTEFAFQSNTNNPTQGNYLAGIDFKAPSFLTVGKSFKDENGDTASFAEGGDSITVELTVKNLGEVPVDNIVITDRLDPYHEYFDYIGNVTVKKGNSTIPFTLGPAPADVNLWTLTVDLKTYDEEGDVDENETLAKGETITVTFEIKIRETCRSDYSLPTLFFYIKNQGKVTFKETEFRNQYRDTTEAQLYNYSKVEKLSISPVELVKTVSPSINGPFEVTLTIKNASTSGEVRKGFFTDNIQPGFRISQVKRDGVLLDSSSFSRDGDSRISVKNIELNSGETTTITYRLEYSGPGYGASNASYDKYPDFRFIYTGSGITEDAKDSFPPQAVGFTVKVPAVPDDFYIDGNDMLNITRKSNFHAGNALVAAGYTLESEVMLCDPAGNVLPFGDNGKDVNGHYIADYPDFFARLNKATNLVEFEPKTATDSTFLLHYRIKLTAISEKTTEDDDYNIVLNSPVATVTIHYVTDTLVYYEQYDDGEFSYGFYAGPGVSVPRVLQNEEIIESGYAVLSASEISFPGYSSPYVNGLYVNIVSKSDEPADNLSLVSVMFKGDLIGKYHPNFAKALYSPTADNAGNTFIIRSFQQLSNILKLEEGGLDTTTLTFTPENGMDPFMPPP